jgi:hypothetical protein
VRKSRHILFVMTLMCLVALAGCHGGSSGSAKLRFVNQTESKKVVEFTLQRPTILARVHMTVFPGRIKGTYVLRDADTTAEGRVTQDEKGFTLVSSEGKKQRFDVEKPDFLKDENGGIWKLSNPTTTATLREY